MKKIFSIFMAMIFAITCSFTNVNADSKDLTADATGSITVNGLEENAVVNLYRIIDVNVDTASNQPKAPVYTWNNNFKDKVEDSYKGTTNGEVLEAFSNLKGADAKKVLEDLATSLPQNADYTATLGEGETSKIFTGVTMGEYLVVVTAPEGSNKIYSITTAQLLPTSTNDGWVLNDVSVTVKSTPKGIDKEVVDGDLSVAIGDTVKYKVTATIPAFPTDTNKTITTALVKIGDKLGTGLTLNANSIVVKNGNTTLTNGKEYTLDTTLTDKYSFEVTLDTDYVLANPNAEITVEYSATVNANAFTTTDALGNKAYQANRNPYTENDYNDVPSPDVKVYTYGIDLTKVAEDKTTTLTGAEFQLKDAEGNAISFVLENGVYRKALPEEQNTTTTLSVNDNGKLSIRGIDTGTYTLTETKAATGMVLPNNPDIKITLVDGSENTDADGTLDTPATNATGDQNIIADNKISTNIFNLSVVNSKDAAFELPNTGGVGTMIFTVAGMLLMAGAVVYLTISHKKA